jgi:adenine-specific DNA-methyltransferase
VTHKKNNGAYYTPELLSEFLMSYVASNYIEVSKLRVFEPSVGDGSFAKAFNKTEFPNRIKSYSFTAIDKVKPELKKAHKAVIASRKKNTRYAFSKIDFLKYQSTLKKKFHLVIGNPPYIKKGLLNKTQIDLCKGIHKSANLSESTVKNIWSAFLVRCTQLLEDNGVLAFVLPAELLQVKFSNEIRSFLKEEYQRIEIFTFEDLLFDCKGQDTVILIGYKNHAKKGQYYTHIEDISKLQTGDFELAQNIGISITDSKWSHHMLAADELTFIHTIGNKLGKIGNYSDSKPGIVSAANNFFIIDEQTEKKYHLSKHTRPIIQKGFFVNGGVTFEHKDFDKLVTEGRPTKILCFNDNEVNRLNMGTETYLQTGVDRNLHERYKCKKRKNWFVIPNISTIPEGFFFKRSHHYPKLLKNNAGVLVTDSAYKIEMKKGYDINHLIYSFYNSLTLTFSELNGRYYGGGVLELIPSEFKSLPIPYLSISSQEFTKYKNAFEKKNEISDVLKANDFHILNSSLNLSSEDITKIRIISKKLIDKRLRK